MPRSQYIGDPLAIRAAAANWLNTGCWDVPASVAASSGQRGQYYYQNPRSGRYYSKYGPLNTIGYIPVLALERAWRGELPLYDPSSGRTLLLNLQNVLLSALLALVLLEISRLFCGRPWLGAVWVLASLYASFGWNYLRAQTSELLQWLLASAFLWAVFQAWRTRGGRGWLIGGQTALVLLVLTKGVYALWGLLWLLLLAALVRSSRTTESGEGGEPWTPRRWLEAAGPLFLGALAVLALNYWRFGDMLASGYTQWERERHFFSGNVLEGLWGFLFSPAKSIFLYQPLLLASLPCWPAFIKRWRLEGCLILLGFVSLWIFNSCTINWGGHWSYGPRYLLAVLTPLSLPSLLAGEYLRSHCRSRGARLLSAVLIGSLLFSLWMQLQVNSLEFFTYYRAEAVCEAYGTPQAAALLRRLPFGIVNYQLKRFAASDRLPYFVQEAARELPPDRSALLQLELLRQVQGNWYWSDGGQPFAAD